VSLGDELQEMLLRDMQGDPIVLDSQFGLGDREATVKDTVELTARIAVSQNRAILRLAEEIDRIAGANP
jgi:hypothetical protein